MVCSYRIIEFMTFLRLHCQIQRLYAVRCKCTGWISVSQKSVKSLNPFHPRSYRSRRGNLVFSSLVTIDVFTGMLIGKAM